MKFKHTSVLLHETIDNLKPKNGGLYVDATFGGGGHARYLLSKIDTGTLIGFDQDEYAIKSAKLNFADLLEPDSEPKLKLVHDNFTNLQRDLVELGYSDGIDGIYYDLGVSSPQFDQADRGFSYRYNARLDMRMDQSQSLVKVGFDPHGTYQVLSIGLFIIDRLSQPHNVRSKITIRIKSRWRGQEFNSWQFHCLNLLLLLAG